MVIKSKKYEQTLKFPSGLRSFRKNNKSNPINTNKPKNFRVDSARSADQIIFPGTFFVGIVFLGDHFFWGPFFRGPFFRVPVTVAVPI